MSGPAKFPKGWLQALDRLLVSGHTEKDLERLSLLLASAPLNWHQSTSAHAPWAPLPCWSRALANKGADPKWIEQALALCAASGASLAGDYRRGRGHRLAFEPVYMGMASHLVDVHPHAYLNYLRRLQHFSPSNGDRSKNALLWLSRMFSRDALWKDDPVSPRVLTWGLLEDIPQLKSAPLGAKVWATGLGFMDQARFAPRALRVLAMGGLDGTIVVDQEVLPPTCLATWPTEVLGEWRPAPAWAWAARLGVFKGSRMLLREVISRQPSPWDPNAPLPKSSQTVGEWLMSTPSLLATPADSSSFPVVVELDTLGFDWFAGPPGSRPIDRMRGWGEKALGHDRWVQLESQAKADQLSRSLPLPASKSGFKARL